MSDEPEPKQPEERGLAHDAIVYGAGAISGGALGQVGAKITDAVTDAITSKPNDPPPPPADKQ